MTPYDTTPQARAALGARARAAHVGLESARDDRPLDPVQQEELRRAKQMKHEIAEQLLPRLLPLANDEGLWDNLRSKMEG